MKIGLLGLGVVGGGVYEIARGLKDVEIKKVLEARFTADYITQDIDEIVNDPEIELVVEVLGGLHPTYEYARKALEAGKHLVSSNKLLVSAYGPELTALARQKGLAFLYSAACGGSIPYLENLSMARRVDQIVALGGILNGTTNFILDAMGSRGMNYDDALAEAQALGYAERDPSSDVDGLDAQQKLILTSAVGFDVYFKPEDIPTRGIAGVLPVDIDYAGKSGRALKLCVRAERAPDGTVSAYVEPTLVGENTLEAMIRANLNCIWYEGENSGVMRYMGQGAGKLPTATNVLRDIRGVAAGRRYMTGVACAPAVPGKASARHGYYLRVKAGVPVPESWAAKQRAAVGDWALYETAPVAVEAMHAFAAGDPAVFFAGIQAE